MDHYEVTQASLGDKVQGNLTHNPAKLHAGSSHHSLLLNLKNFSRYCEAHGGSPRSQYTITALEWAVTSVTPKCDSTQCRDQVFVQPTLLLTDVMLCRMKGSN
jgi:hypothetical protein